jgi:hypothetical protein
MLNMKRTSTIITIVLIVSIAAFTYSKWVVANPIAMIHPEDITTIERGTGMGLKAMVPIPESKFRDVIETLGAATNEPNPMKWQVADEIVITESNGRTTELTFFHTNEDFHAFRTGKHYFRFEGDIPFNQD